MKKLLLALLITCLSLFSTISVSSCDKNSGEQRSSQSTRGKTKNYTRIDENGTENENGNYILFGSYPQTDVTSSISTTLSSYVSAKPTTTSLNGWTSYKYYIEWSNETDFMWYKDVDIDSNGAYDYRAVYFTSYRPNYIYNTSSIDNAWQDENGYTTGNVYWFKWEAIKWRILEEADGKAIILAEIILDSQGYNYEGIETDEDPILNNYEYSSIRVWLNDNFYNTAFNDLQKAIIQTVEVDNSARSTNSDNNATELNDGNNSYACNNTQDKVWLLSVQEATTESYGFSTISDACDILRQKKTTAYSQCQGAYTMPSDSYVGNGYWWLRSSCYDDGYTSRLVNCDGDTFYADEIDACHNGVAPALRIEL